MRATLIGILKSFRRKEIVKVEDAKQKARIEAIDQFFNHEITRVDLDKRFKEIETL